jgi:hypothetical protein
VRGDRETQNTHNWSEDYKDRKGDAAGAAPGCPIAAIDIISFITMRGSSSSLDYEIVEEAYINLSIVLH